MHLRVRLDSLCRFVERMLGAGPTLVTLVDKTFGRP